MGELKKCTQCGEEKTLSEFHRHKQGDRGRRAACKSCRKDYAAKLHQSKRLGYWIVYYLPVENRCGITDEPVSRMRCHEKLGRNTSGWKVLFCSEDRNEARYHEALFQSTLGMEGLSYS